MGGGGGCVFNWSFRFESPKHPPKLAARKPGPSSFPVFVGFIERLVNIMIKMAVAMKRVEGDKQLYFCSGMERRRCEIFEYYELSYTFEPNEDNLVDCEVCVIYASSLTKQNSLGNLD